MREGRARIARHQDAAKLGRGGLAGLSKRGEGECAGSYVAEVLPALRVLPGGDLLPAWLEDGVADTVTAAVFAAGAGLLRALPRAPKTSRAAMIATAIIHPWCLRLSLPVLRCSC